MQGRGLDQGQGQEPAWGLLSDHRKVRACFREAPPDTRAYTWQDTQPLLRVCVCVQTSILSVSLK